MFTFSVDVITEWWSWAGNNHPLFTLQREQHNSPAPEHVSCISLQLTLSRLWQWQGPGAVPGSTSGTAASALHTQKVHQVPALSLGSTHAFLWSCSWCLTLQGMNFPNQAEVPLLSGFSLLAVTPVCLTYRQRSHLSPCSSPAHPTAQHRELQAPHDNTPKQK